ncbi:hypothetical protein L596_022749 [Steinernema carpocapsae]|uniref:Uncharacterized protein n=1 Tax=Steinernema carpocapsae TaxID=34508 RepID=A0A4U5MMJ9_STECR|nr:hypothetical protein L596_022749 [Steinernema carpocapsae]
MVVHELLFKSSTSISSCLLGETINLFTVYPIPCRASNSRKSTSNLFLAPPRSMTPGPFLQFYHRKTRLLALLLQASHTTDIPKKSCSTIFPAICHLSFSVDFWPFRERVATDEYSLNERLTYECAYFGFPRRVRFWRIFRVHVGKEEICELINS